LGLLASCGSGSKDEAIAIAEDDAAMNAVILEARETLDDFVARLQNPQPTDRDFALKVEITDENGTEHFWANEVRVTGDGFTAVINNDPNIVKSVDLGERVSVGRDMVSDWMYRDNEVMIGNHTLRVLLGKMPKDEADALKKQCGWEQGRYNNYLQADMGNDVKGPTAACGGNRCG